MSAETSIEKAMRHARAAEKLDAEFPGSSGACPSWWRSRIKEAQKGHGGGYAKAGRDLATLVNGTRWDLSDELVSEFEDTFQHDDTGARLVQWAERAFPRAMALVPAGKRMTTFLEGVESAITDELFED